MLVSLFYPKFYSMNFKNLIVTNNTSNPIEIEFSLDKKFFNSGIGYYINFRKKTELLKILQSHYEKILESNISYQKIYNVTPIVIVDKINNKYTKLASFNVEKERNLPFKISYPNSIIKDMSPN